MPGFCVHGHIILSTSGLSNRSYNNYKQTEPCVAHVANSFHQNQWLSKHIEDLKTLYDNSNNNVTSTVGTKKSSGLPW